MNEQMIVNIGFGVIMMLIGWLMKIFWDALDNLKKENARNFDKIASVEVAVAGQYVKRDELERTLNTVSAQLNRIEDKLDKKVDK